MKSGFGEKSTNRYFSSKINYLPVKQSLHLLERSRAEAVCDRFATHVHNVSPENLRWNSECELRQVPDAEDSPRIMARIGPPPGPTRWCSPLNDPAAANAALNAFLRGVERRGAVFAEWQGGSAEAGDLALATSLRGFREVAAGVPFAEWPRRFWAMLLASPHLRGIAGAGAAADHPPHLVALGSGPRAALLLRLVAGLAESEAAAVLGISRPTYRLALRQALPRRADGDPDPDAWRALSTAAQQAVRALPGERLERIAMLRDGLRPRPVRKPAAPRDPTRPRWLWPATIAILLLTIAALAATWWPWSWPWPGGSAPGSGVRIQIEDLPPASPAAARFDPSTALEAHRDLELLLAQVRAEFDEHSDPAFDAWLAAGAGTGEPAVATPEASSDVDAASPEQFDAPR